MRLDCVAGGAPGGTQAAAQQMSHGAQARGASLRRACQERAAHAPGSQSNWSRLILAAEARRGLRRAPPPSPSPSPAPSTGPIVPAGGCPRERRLMGRPPSGPNKRRPLDCFHFGPLVFWRAPPIRRPAGNKTRRRRRGAFAGARDTIWPGGGRRRRFARRATNDAETSAASAAWARVLRALPKPGPAKPGASFGAALGPRAPSRRLMRRAARERRAARKIYCHATRNGE